MDAKEFLKKQNITNVIINKSDLPEYWKSISDLIEEYQAKALNKTNVMLRLNQKLEEYRIKRDDAKAICDKQEKFDVSFEAEVEDEIFLIADRQYNAIKDLYDYVTNAT